MECRRSVGDVMELSTKLGISATALIGLLVALVYGNPDSPTCESASCQPVQDDGLLYAIPITKNGDETTGQPEVRASEFAPLLPVPTPPPASNDQIALVTAEEVVQDRQLIRLAPAAPIQDVNVVPAACEECQYGGSQHVPNVSKPSVGHPVARTSYVQSAEPVRLADMDRLNAPYRSIKPAVPPIDLQSKTCIVRDDSYEKTMTITLLGNVQTSSLSVESQERAVQATGCSRQGPTCGTPMCGSACPATNRLTAPRTLSTAVSQSAQPMGRSANIATKPKSGTNATELAIDLDQSTGGVSIDASNVEISGFLKAMATRIGKPIAVSPTVSGTISATVSAQHPELALRRMLEPFGFSVSDYQNGLYVCRHGEPTTPVAPVVMPPAVQQKGPQPSQHQFVIASPVREMNTVPAASLRRSQVASSAPSTNPGMVQRVSAEMPIARESREKPKAVNIVPVDMAPNALQRPNTLPTPPAKPIRPKNIVKNKPAVKKKTAGRTKVAKSAPLPGDVRIAMLAQDAFSVGKSAYAREVLTEGVIRYPSSALLLRLLGEGYYFDSEYEAAQEALAQAVNMDKYDSYANELLGQTLAKLGQSQRASHYLMQAQTLKRTTPQR